MARNYKRDSRGRFAKVAGKALAAHGRRKTARKKYIMARAVNDYYAKQVVREGSMSRKQARSALKAANRHAKQDYKDMKKGRALAKFSTGAR